MSRPHFMTLAMWFAWLLRGDVRQGMATDDADGQREFVAWWLLWGRSEYPAVWSWGRPQADVAMQLVPIGRGLRCPRLLRRLHLSRLDLQQAFELRDEESLAEYFCWYRLYGALELDATPTLPADCLAMTEAPSERDAWCTGGLQVPRIAVSMAHRSLDLQQSKHGDPAGTARLVLDWYRSHSCSALATPNVPRAPALRLRAERRQKGGVNLVGFVCGQFGLGEDVRMASAALEAAEIPHVLINVPAGAAVAQQDDSLTHALQERLPYRLTIYCMSAFDMAVLYLARGPAFFAGQYRIGYWPWELPALPAQWRDIYRLVDEVWAGSKFTALAHRTHCRKPVHRLPCPVTVPPIRPTPRRELGLLNERAFLFVYPFDINSHLARKNPLALVRAFRLAFDSSDTEVALLLRVNGRPEHQPGWAEVAAECVVDRRIRILSGTLDRQAALSVVAAADCLVSSHRSEGFGRNIAEAILLGIPVLATAYSGCMDFLAGEEGIPFTRVRLQVGEYPFGEGLWWADPSVQALARRMRQVRSAGRHNGLRNPQRLAQRRAEVAAAYSPLKTGKVFAARLRQIERRLARSQSEQRSKSRQH
jgi:glycosyltransferase involved in cell wall biosynthesis